VFAKLVAVVVALGACGSTLLALRQSRLQVASEIAQTQIRINQEDERLWVLRAKIAERVTPEQVEQMASTVGPLRPLVPPVIDEKAKAEAERKLAQAKEREAQAAKPKPTAAKPKPDSRAKPESRSGGRGGSGRLARGDSR
jgi:hypothetical protein